MCILETNKHPNLRRKSSTLHCFSTWCDEVAVKKIQNTCIPVARFNPLRVSAKGACELANTTPETWWQPRPNHGHILLYWPSGWKHCLVTAHWIFETSSPPENKSEIQIYLEQNQKWRALWCLCTGHHAQCSCAQVLVCLKHQILCKQAKYRRKAA